MFFKKTVLVKKKKKKKKKIVCTHWSKNSLSEVQGPNFAILYIGIKKKDLLS
eukprot:SAG11_NODE_24194_length_376_cov_151.288809_1_plen_51_part_01